MVGSVYPIYHLWRFCSAVKVMFLIILFMHFWLCWIFVARLFLTAVSRGCSLGVVPGFSLQWLLLRQGTGLRAPGASVAAAPRLNRCGAWAKLLQGTCDRPGGSSPCLLHGQADSLPLSHQGSPAMNFKGKEGSNLSDSLRWGVRVAATLCCVQAAAKTAPDAVYTVYSWDYWRGSWGRDLVIC